jgi:type I restriction enzyme S subunit
VIGVDGALVGRNYALIDDVDLPSLLVQRVARLRTSSKACSRFLLAALTVNDRFAAHVDTVKTHTAIPHITSRDISDSTVAFPADGERRQIVDRIDSFNNRVRFENEELEKLIYLKHGLMDDLLTGWVRVSVPEEAAA